jgi:ATP-dependent DNA helicase RecQ
VVSNVLEENPQIVVLPTGAGKSLCFQLPALLLPGPTLVLMPLLSLISDQERKLRERGIPVGILRGGLTRDEKSRLWAEMRSRRLVLLLATPESCLAEENLAALKTCGIRHVVVDEAHCISEWGDTFRPAYLQVGFLVRSLSVKMVSAFTATASEAVTDRIRTLLFGDLDVRLVAGGADRPGIHYAVRPVLSRGHALMELAETAERPLLVFCRTRNATELTARGLRYGCPRHAVAFYHAGLSREERISVEKWFLDSPDGTLVATCAYGLGVDKPDIRTVVHADIPASAEAYLQESGRAGRDGRPSRAIVILDRRAEHLHLGRLQDPRAAGRFELILSYAREAGGCRRNRLLSLIGQPPVACAGCDTCDGTAKKTAAGEEQIMAFVSRYRRRFSPGEIAEILSAAPGPGSVRAFHDCIPGSGGLAGWSIRDAETALRALVAEGRLHISAGGPWKGRLTLPPFRARRLLHPFHAP